MTHDMITRSNSTSNEKNTQVRMHTSGSSRKAVKIVLATALAFAVVLAVVLGFVIGSVVGGSDSEKSDDGSNVVVPEGANEVPDSGGEVSVDDHDALVGATPSSSISGVDLSGDPTDLYFVVSAPEGSNYSLTTYSTDESGQRIENEMKNVSDTTTVLTPEDTGLHVKEGVLLIDEQGASGNCGQQFASQRSGVSDPGCSYGISYVQPQPNEDDPTVIVAFDGTGQVIVNKQFYSISMPMFFKNEGGKLVERTE